MAQPSNASQSVESNIANANKHQLTQRRTTLKTTTTNKMFKICILIGLAIAGVASAQEAGEQAAAPEPYSYAYETDTHAASEQRDPSGKVTGFYTLADADGRSRRVEYTADESGFHAKVATNEVGTKSENPADVVVEASPPTEAQYSYVSNVQQAPSQQAFRSQVVQSQQQQQPRYVVSQQVQQQPGRSGYSYVQQGPSSAGYSAQYGYYPGSSTTYSSYNQGYGNYGYGANGYGANGYGVNGYGLGVGNYNNHLPSQYYRSVSTTTGYQPGFGGVRYVNQPGSNYGGSYRSVGYQTVGTPGVVSYSSNAGPSTTTRTVSSSSSGGLSGSSNYIVLKKAK